MSSPMKTEGPIAPASYAAFRDALIEGDRRACRAAVQQWIADGLDMLTVYRFAFQRALYDVGEQWAAGRIGVATEHLATAIVEDLLGLFYTTLFDRPHGPSTAVVACTANEYHQLGGKMVADAFEWHGWRSRFLGANTPIDDLAELVRATQPRAVALSLTMYFNLPKLLETVGNVRRAAPRVPILLGGQAFARGARASVALLEGATLVASLPDLEVWIRRYEQAVH